MRQTKKLILGICLFSFVASLILISLLPNSAIVEKNQTNFQNNKVLDLKSSYTSVNPITIDGNESFWALKVNPWCTGNGSELNPYVIRGISINGGETSHCLIIKNIDENFTITECLFEDSGDNKAGIYLQGVTNGEIINNTIDNNAYGIQLVNCSSNDITENIFSSNQIAIKLNQGTPLTICDNNIWLNFIIYSRLAQIQIYNANNNLDNNSCGNFWTSFKGDFDKNQNFTVQTKGKSIILFVAKLDYNVSLSPLIQDQFPLIANDTDNDGLDDLIEVLYWGTLLDNADTDADGMPDEWECINDLDPLVNDAEKDADGDDLDNIVEYEIVYEHDDGSKHYTDPNDDDTDNDGWSDGEEVDEETDPTNYFDHPQSEHAGGFVVNDLIDPEFLISLLPIGFAVLSGIGVVATLVVLKKSAKEEKPGVKTFLKPYLALTIGLSLITILFELAGYQGVRTTQWVSAVLSIATVVILFLLAAMIHKNISGGSVLGRRIRFLNYILLFLIMFVPFGLAFVGALASAGLYFVMPVGTDAASTGKILTIALNLILLGYGIWFSIFCLVEINFKKKKEVKGKK